MKFRHVVTNDVVEIPPCDPTTGYSVVIFNGRVVLNVRYSENPMAVTTLENGRVYDPIAFGRYIREQLNTGAWRAQA